MADNQVKFYRGNKPANFDNLDRKGIYFFEDTRELWVNDKFYGMSKEQSDKLANLESDLNGFETSLGTTSELAQQLLGIVGADDNKGLRARLIAVEGQAAANATAVSDAASAAVSAAEAATAAQGKADAAFENAGKAQDDVDALARLVGQLPEGTTASTVIGYVNAKTAGIATDAALEELNSQVSTLQTAVQTTIPETYATKEALQSVSEEISKAMGNISVDVADTKATVETFMASADLKEDAIDTLQEIQTYIKDDLAAADVLVKRVGANEEAIAAINESIEVIDGDIEGLQATDEAVLARLSVVEGQLGKGEGSVSDQIADAEQAAKNYADGLINELVEGTLNDIQEAAKELKSEVEANVEAIEAVSTVADQATQDILTLQALVEEKAAASDLEALEEAINGEGGYADRISSAEIDIEALQGTVAELDKIDHSHTDLDALNEITMTKVTAWDSAYDNSVSYTDQCLAWNLIENS